MNMPSSNPMNEMSSFNNSQPEKQQPANPGFNVDDLVRKIDAKIAEIEAEEKRQKELEEKAKQEKPKSVVEEAKTEDKKDVPKPSIDDYLQRMNETTAKKQEEKIVEAPKDIEHTNDTYAKNNVPIVGKPVVAENKIIHEDKIQKREVDITDDQFFDDFFDDEV